MTILDAVLSMVMIIYCIGGHKFVNPLRMKLTFSLGSGYFASRGKIAPCYFAIWQQNSANGYFAASAKIALSPMLTQSLTQTLILTLIPTLALNLTQTLTQTEEKHYFVSRGKITGNTFFRTVRTRVLNVLTNRYFF